MIQYQYYKAYTSDTATDTNKDVDRGVENFVVAKVTLEMKFSTCRSQIIITYINNV